MSCPDCDDFQDSPNTAYYRWGAANVEIRACKKHMLEIFDALNESQNEEDALSLCPNCFCITKTFNGKCGKCKEEK